jgi:hypothetical protein
LTFDAGCYASRPVDVPSGRNLKTLELEVLQNDYTKDHFAVVSLAESVKVPYGAFTDALLTKEWTPIEREVLTHKYYVRGIGEVRDVAVRGPKEEFVLVAVAR